MGTVIAWMVAVVFLALYVYELVKRGEAKRELEIEENKHTFTLSQLDKRTEERNESREAHAKTKEKLEVAFFEVQKLTDLFNEAMRSAEAPKPVVEAPKVKPAVKPAKATPKAKPSKKPKKK